MFDVRYPSREPVSPGPSMLMVLVTLGLTTYLLRLLFAMPLPPGIPPPGALSLDSLGRGEWWTVLTHIFTHEGLWHLVPNMLLLFLAGRAVERNAGPQHFVYIFLFSAWVGAALFMVLHGDQAIIGASGGVMGVIGAFTAMHPEYDLMRPFRRFVSLHLKARHLFPALMTVFVVLEVASRLVQGVSWEGFYREAHLVHAGGLLTGWFYGRRLNAGGRRYEDWADFFPQGMRRRFRGEEPVDLPVAAGFPLQESDERSEFPSPAPSRELTDHEFLRERVDLVLEKLYATGADNLTDEEKAVLEEASRRFSRQQP